MKCPNDGTTLQMTSRENIEIDYCPECRGVWLDRGELDKLIDRSVESVSPTPPAPAAQASPTYQAVSAEAYRPPTRSHDDHDRTHND